MPRNARAVAPRGLFSAALASLVLVRSAKATYVDPPFDFTRVLFSATFSNDMVLQRAPQRAAVFGTATPGAAVTVRVAGPGGFAWSSAPAPVAQSADASLNGTWKVVLPACGAGFGYSVEAACDGCPNATTAALAGVGFGDVFLCSGQSNMVRLPAAPPPRRALQLTPASVSPSGVPDPDVALALRRLQ
jgi:sialate O-acetylesterase